MSSGKPGKVSSIIHKAYSLHQQGKLDRAEKNYHKALKYDPQNFDALQGMGAIALHKKQFKRSIKLLESAIGINPNEPGLLTNLGLAYKHSGDNTKARHYFEKCISLDNTFGPAYYNLALLYLNENNLEQALTILHDSERCRPGHIPTLTSIAHTLNLLGESNEAINYYKHAIQLDPDNANLHFDLGKIFQVNRCDSEAINELKKAVSLNPGFIDARAKLADILESTNCLDEAKSEAEMVLSIKPDHALACLVAAKIERRNGNLEAARNRLLKCSKNIETEMSNYDISAGILTEMGIILDRLNEYDDAFCAFRRANRIMAELPATRLINPQQAFRIVDAYCLWIKNRHQQNVEKKKIEENIDDLPSPVFLVGFPRSGTTLTEQILAAHKNISTSDELPVLHDIATNISTILGREVDYPDSLDTLTVEDIHDLRQYYWDQMTSVLGTKAQNQLFIDKMPLNIIHLGLINCLFPQSQLILALRDPRDVCLSCFMQLFLVNDSMLQFLDINSTAKYYAAVMGLWLQYKELLENKQFSLDWIESRYEDIVTNPDQGSARLYNFLGIDKDKVTGDFHQQAAKRSISTPSYQDVSAPIYQRARGRWRHYQNHLEPVLDEMMPFIKAFGYPL